MCMLCVVPPNVIPSRDKLENSALNNPHGFGFAIVVPDEKRIICERTMDADESINRFIETRIKYPQGYALWHARYATHGTQTVDNCHPFKLGGHDERTYIAHNGVLDVIEYKHEQRSDTRIFVEDMLPLMGGITAFENEQMYNLIERFATGSKLCVLTVDERASYQCYIVNEYLGKRDESDVWWSNDSCYLDYGYSRRPYSYLGTTTKYTATDDVVSSKHNKYDYIWCDICDWTGVEADIKSKFLCPQCACCMECYQFVDACLCYVPEPKSKEQTYTGWEMW